MTLTKCASNFKFYRFSNCAGKQCRFRLNVRPISNCFLQHKISNDKTNAKAHEVSCKLISNYLSIDHWPLNAMNSSNMTMGERKQEVYSLIKCINKSYLGPYRCLSVFPSCSLNSIQIMAKHGFILFSVKVRIFPLTHDMTVVNVFF